MLFNGTMHKEEEQENNTQEQKYVNGVDMPVNWEHYR